MISSGVCVSEPYVSAERCFLAPTSPKTTRLIKSIYASITYHTPVSSHTSTHTSSDSCIHSSFYRATKNSTQSIIEILSYNVTPLRSWFNYITDIRRTRYNRDSILLCHRFFGPLYIFAHIHYSQSNLRMHEIFANIRHAILYLLILVAGSIREEIRKRKQLRSKMSGQQTRFTRSQQISRGATSAPRGRLDNPNCTNQYKELPMQPDIPAQYNKPLPTRDVSHSKCS